MKAWHLVFAAVAVFVLYHYWSTVTAVFHPANLRDAAGGQNTPAPTSKLVAPQQGYY